jgi:acyl-CoA synthetase (AMP-forming)/AMP-acid ligase II
VKAVVLRAVGGELELGDWPEPAGSVVEVRAAGVNFADVLIRRGLYPQMPELPTVLGSEVAGELEGQRVIALTRAAGGYAERVEADPQWIFPLPDGASFAAGAAFLTTFLTAFIPLTRQARVSASSTVLVHAGSGGVGSAAIQLAKHLGAKVVATASTEPKRAVARELGADDETKFDYIALQGLPLPLVELRNRDGDGNVLPWDGESVGELEIRGPWVAAGYYDTPDQSDRWTDDGWFRTGDVVSLHPGGYIQIKDRSKDVIKSGGEWISSVELENALMAHPAVAEAAVIAIPDPKWDERPLAAVVLREGQTATPDELRAFLAPDFAKWWLPDRFEFVAEIPKTSVGKFRKTELREMFATEPVVHS